MSRPPWYSKTTVPHVPPGAVVRTELIETSRRTECRVVGVTAPAGYGKTTLLAQWAETEDRPVAWVSLDPLDDDPAALLTLLGGAFMAAVPGHADLVADLRGRTPLGRAAPVLASALKASPVPFVMMLDDLQELHSSACYDMLDVVIAGIPRGSQLVVASRVEQPYVPRLRAAGDAHEVLMDDLALAAGDTEAIFAENHVAVTHEQARIVTERAEGWPVGLYLAAVIARNSGEVPTMSGEDPYVADYLYREALASVPEDLQHFLRFTAVLEHMCAPLCDVLLETQGAQEQLRRLEALNLFLTPLDRHRDWFRYHSLFREFLLGELRRVEPEAIRKLHMRAADWYEENDSPAAALEHLLNTDEHDRAAKLLTQLVLPMYNVGQMSTVERWLAALGEGPVKQYSPLAVLAGWMAVMTGQPADAERWATIVEASTFDPVPVDGTASFDSARAMLRACMVPAGSLQMMADADFALAQEPASGPWRDTALVESAEAHLLSGEPDRAAKLFAEGAAVAGTAGSPNNVAVSNAELALLAMERGQWDEAAGRVHVALEIIEEHGLHGYASSVLISAAAARVALHLGDHAQVDRQLTRAMRSRPIATYVLPFLAVRARLQLARVYQARGDRGTARHLLREIEDIMLRRPDLGALVDEVAAFRQVLSASADAGALGVPPLTGAELRLLPYLQTHLTIREIGERLFVSRNTVSSEVGSIYRKLGVSSRNEAVERATEIGLLGA